MFAFVCGFLQSALCLSNSSMLWCVARLLSSFSVVPHRMNVPQFVHPSTVGRHLVSFQFGVNIDKAAMNIVLYIFW